MKQTTGCPRCGRAVSFEEEDRGYEVYCPSCQHALVVPAADAASSAPAPTSPAATTAVPQSSAPAPSSSSIFSTRSTAALDDRVIDHVECSCGFRNPFSLADLGNSIYCESCGLEIPVRREWQAESRPSAPPPEPPPAASTAPASAIPVTTSAPQWLGSQRNWVMASMLVIAIPALALFARRPAPPLVLEVVPPAGPPAPAPLKKRSIEELPPFDPAALTPEMIDGLTEAKEPFQAIVQALAWRDGLRKANLADDERASRCQTVAAQILTEKKETLQAMADAIPEHSDPEEAQLHVHLWSRALRELKVPPTDPLAAALLRAARELIEKLDPITLEMIDALPSRPHNAEALAQAAMWRSELSDRGAAENDPRFARLDKAVAAIQARNRRAPTATAQEKQQFQQAVQKLADALQQQDLSAAQAAAQSAEALLREHPEALASSAIRLQTLKGKLRILENRVQGLQKVRQLFQDAERNLNEAEGLANSDPAAAEKKVSQAVYLSAQARLKVFQGHWKKGEVEEFDRTFESMRSKLQYARGWRAAVNAKRADAQKDAGLRKKQADRAFALLQGLPEAQIKPWLSQVRAWHESENAPATSSPLGQEIELWDRFESFLDHFAVADLAKLTPQCIAIQNQVNRAPVPRDAFHRRIGDLLFELIESKYATLLADGADVRQEKVAQGLQEIGAALDQLGAWQDDPRSRAVRAMIREQMAPIARERLQQAQAKANEGRWAEAIALAEPLASTAAPQVATEARDLTAVWKRELDALADRKVQEDDWRTIKAALRTATSAQALTLLDTHLKRWPSGTHADEARAQREQSARVLRQNFRDEMQRLRRSVEQNDWSAVARTLPSLEAIASDDEREALRGWRAELDLKQQTAQRLVRALGDKRLMRSAEDVLAVRYAGQQVLALFPDDAEARQLVEMTREGADRVAKSLLSTARMYRAVKPDKSRSQLEMILKLHPSENLASEAQRMLQGL